MSFEFGEILKPAEVIAARCGVLKNAIYNINEKSKQFVVVNETSSNVAEVKSSIEINPQPVNSEPSPVVNVNVDFTSGSAISANTSNIARSIVDDNQPTTPESEVEDRLARLRSEAALHARPAGDQPIERNSDEIVGSGSVS